MVPGPAVDNDKPIDKVCAIAAAENSNLEDITGVDPECYRI